ncbi:uncharacterized protein BBOV_IV001090 [Babesia bovis T2Bo]|uniref:Uncharacterized protein n=1 Tax=Babesia bovis TaxID=5865 RepID=A7AV80_BABBO|nr:uncharacterized protein BBOV_IV001090 [Babesia bovis T2Bo]EDO05706.1 hypothetical protein BBOV_IV001090 [Babesia bovis T2Bo]|eukprot:XP_001609274.1 hypothetical protein [Babesia bovis T2Bo]
MEFLAIALVAPAVARLQTHGRQPFTLRNNNGDFVYSRHEGNIPECFIGCHSSPHSIQRRYYSGVKPKRRGYHLGADTGTKPRGPLTITSNHGLLGRFWKKLKGFFVNAKKKGSRIGNDKSKLPIQTVRQLPTMGLGIPVSIVENELDSTEEASPYMQLVHTSPSNIIAQFVDQAPSRVKEAVKSTVGALVGSIYRYCLETTMITTTERIASLVQSMQMTGYMLWNAECRCCLSQQLQNDVAQSLVKDVITDEYASPGLQLKEQLPNHSNREGLLWYIKNMPNETANALLDNITTDVMDAMQKSVDIVVESLIGMVTSQKPTPMGPQNTGVIPKIIIQQTGSSCVQLCFWQLALGYCLRQQEAKLELQRTLNDS